MAVMTSMRTRMHIVLWAVLILFLLSMAIGGLVGGANIIDQLLGRTNPAEAIGVVNGEKIPPDFFNQLVNQQLDQYRAAGQTINDQTLELVREQVWKNIIRENLIADAIEEMGITATDEEVVFHLQNNPPQFIRTLPAFQTNGTFDGQKYLDAINNPEGNEWAPVEQIMKTNIIPNYKLQKMIASSITVTDEEVWDEYVRQNVNYTIDAIHITERSVDEADLEISESEVKRAYNNRKDEFEQPKSRDIRFVSWPKQAQQRDTTLVYENALDIIEQIKEGEDFAYMANLYTEDPGNFASADSARGGDLGWFEKGQMVKPFSDAAFAARKGAVVGPVLSQFGYHIIKVHDKRRSNGKDQVQASHILLKISIGAETRDALRRAATLFSYDAQDYGFDAALDTHSVAPFETMVFESDILVNPIGQFRNAVRYAFFGEIGEISSPLENDNYFAVFEILGETPEGYKSMEEVRDQIEGSIRTDKIKNATKLVADKLQEQINNNSSFEEVFNSDNSYEYIDNESNTIRNGFRSLAGSNYANGAVLNSNIGDVLGPIRTGRGYTILKIIEISEIDSTDWAVKKNIFKNNILRTKENQSFEDWINDLEARAEIEDFRQYHF